MEKHALLLLLLLLFLADCPIPNVKYTREEYSTSALISTFSPLVTSGPPSPCTAQVQGLATCAFDGSLEVKQGCCSTACSEQMKQVRIAV
jgi:hypothetical protein